MKKYLIAFSVFLFTIFISAEEKLSSSAVPDEKTAKSAAVMAFLYDRIPGSARDPGSEIVIVDPAKGGLYDFQKIPGNLIVQLVREDKVYSGVDFSEKEGKLVLRGFELESMEFPEKNAPDLKYRVGFRERISQLYVEFFRTDVMKIASDRLKTLSEKK